MRGLYRCGGPLAAAALLLVSAWWLGRGETAPESAANAAAAVRSGRLALTSTTPVKRFQDLLFLHSVVDEDAGREIDERVKAEFDEGYAFAQASPFPVPEEATMGLWVEDGYWAREPSREGGTEAG